MREAQSGDISRLRQRTLKYEAGIVNVIAMAAQERLGAQVAGQKARQFAAAVEPEIKRIVRRHGAGKQSFRAFSGEVALATAQQFGADALARMARANTEGADHPGFRGDAILLIVGAQSRMREANELIIVHRDDEAVRVEIGLGEKVVLQGRAMPQFDAAAAEEGLVPDHGQAWRIVITETAKVNHEGQPHTTWPEKW